MHKQTKPMKENREQILDLKNISSLRKALEGTTVVQHFNNMRVCERKQDRRQWELSVLSAQFRCEGKAGF